MPTSLTMKLLNCESSIHYYWKCNITCLNGEVSFNQMDVEQSSGFREYEARRTYQRHYWLGFDTSEASKWTGFGCVLVCIVLDTLGFQVQHMNPVHCELYLLTFRGSISFQIESWAASARNIDVTLIEMQLSKTVIFQCELGDLEQLTRRRCYKLPDFGVVISCHLHTFSAASECGYGTDSYLRLTNEAGVLRISH